jgi:hypothetical protein
MNNVTYKNCVLDQEWTVHLPEDSPSIGCAELPITNDQNMIYYNKAAYLEPMPHILGVLSG